MFAIFRNFLTKSIFVPLTHWVSDKESKYRIDTEYILISYISYVVSVKTIWKVKPCKMKWSNKTK